MLIALRFECLTEPQGQARIFLSPISKNQFDPGPLPQLMDAPTRTTLLRTARVHWRSFAPAWGFPFVFLFGGLAAERIGHPLIFFFLVAVPLFFWSFSRATAPWLKQEIGYWHCIFWAVVVRFLLWVFAVAANLGLNN